ncbi:orotate phosphoribosyltransferase [Halobacillus dabanensis]|uniref:Orotate phosphoribosyltransferase n=1 Tax=Halobacillus dabanensis TaxID=240302 RepID=A0A1I3VI62_HALDA|nr:orotate phosphoribosyltransferase [Halobacillus dabanensis]SFJ94036.1 orotate phosphoribosyltransferase [Halobacillus dabanensis]
MDNKRLIRDLLEIGAVKVQTEDFFTWTSGIKSPIYCDNRLTMSYPEIRSTIAGAFVEKIESLNKEVDVIAGCATAGIPHAAWIAERMNLPMVYVRSSAKKHGKGNQIEGQLQKGQRAVVIEDLISTGKSSVETADALHNAGVEVLDVFSIFTYGLREADQTFSKKGYTYQSLASYEDLLAQMVEDEHLTFEQKELLEKWRMDPHIFTKA